MRYIQIYRQKYVYICQDVSFLKKLKLDKYQCHSILAVSMKKTQISWLFRDTHRIQTSWVSFDAEFYED